MAHRTPIVCCFLMALATGCSALSAGRTEWVAYRTYRYEAYGPRRIEAAGRYLHGHPQGAFAHEVRAALQGADEALWGTVRGDCALLPDYLRLFPQGAHAVEATLHQRHCREAADDASWATDHATRAGLLDHLERYPQGRHVDEARARLRALDDELAGTARLQRQAVRRAFTGWVHLLGSLDGWGEDLAIVDARNPGFAHGIREGVSPVCHAGHCRRTVSNPFLVPVPGRSVQSRDQPFVLDLGCIGPTRRLQQALLSLPDHGFTRWWEAEQSRVSDVHGAADREPVVAWAMDQLRAIVATAFPGARETPPALFGPPPRLASPDIAEDDAPETPDACAVPTQPAGTRWSVVVGCGQVGGTTLVASSEAMTAHAASVTTTAVAPRTCLRIDAFAALDAPGMPRDEGLALSMVPACAVGRGRR
jgi:hypothetical protein